MKKEKEAGDGRAGCEGENERKKEKRGSKWSGPDLRKKMKKRKEKERMGEERCGLVGCGRKEWKKERGKLFS